MSGTENVSPTAEKMSMKGNGIIRVELAFIAIMVMFIEIMLVPALPSIAQEKDSIMKTRQNRKGAPRPNDV
jgi:hypothetical protein